MKKPLPLLLIGIILSLLADAQIAQFTFNSNRNASSNAPTISVSTMNVVGSSGFYSTGAANGCKETYGTDNYATTGALDLNKYYEITFYPTVSSSVNITHVLATGRAQVNGSTNGPNILEIRSSEDNYATSLGSNAAPFTNTCEARTIFLSNTVSSTDAVTLRLYYTAPTTPADLFILIL